MENNLNPKENAKSNKNKESSKKIKVTAIEETKNPGDD